MIGSQNPDAQIGNPNVIRVFFQSFLKINHRQLKKIKKEK
jgi:hypothetical protein